MSEIGKQFGWNGAGKYESRDGSVWDVVASGRELS